MLVKRKHDSPLRTVRRMRTMSQEDLARVAGISQETLSKFERGLLRPSPDMQALLATILGSSRVELFPIEETVAAS